jgi:hypothetical protein
MQRAKGSNGEGYGKGKPKQQPKQKASKLKVVNNST